jgi:hypothetical protein
MEIFNLPTVSNFESPLEPTPTTSEDVGVGEGEGEGEGEGGEAIICRASDWHLTVT